MARDEDILLRSVALQNANSILIARQRAEQDLIEAKEALERKTQELAHSLAMVRSTLEATTDAILVTAGSGRVIELNRRYVELWRLSQEVVDTRDHWRILQACSILFADPERFLARVGEIYGSASEESFDVLHFLDGRIVERSSRIQVVEQRNVGRVWSFREITERRRLEEGRFRLAAIVESSEDAIVGKKLDGTITSWNQGAERIFGYTADEVLGKSVTILIPPERADEEPHIIDKLKQGERIEHYETVRMRKDGSLLHVSLAVSPIRDSNGTIVGAAKIARDISERIRAAEERTQLLDAERAARAEAERLNLMKDEFLANLSHELRTPLNAILGWSQILAMGNATPEVKQGLYTIERNAKAQAQLIEDLLDMNRIVSGKIRLDVQLTSLANVVDSAIEAVRPSVEAKGIRLRRIIDPGAGPVSGDPNRLQQVVWNLLSNAAKFTPREGSIDVLVERVDSHLEITVKDSGQGIDPEFLPYIFERFRQADASTTRKHSGLGLGLSIVKQLVDLHGGTVRADSNGPGQGATFIVSLPLAPICRADNREHPTTAKALASSFGDVSLDDITVLVIDDEADARELIRRVLTHHNAVVVTAGSAMEGLKELKSCKPHVLVSDIGMPEMDGYALIRSVRGLPRSEGGRTPAIALTAFARSEDRTRTMIAGYQVHISKPIEPHELLATVASLAGRTEMREQQSDSSGGD